MDKDFDLEKPIHEDADENVYWEYVNIGEEALLEAQRLLDIALR